MIKINNQIAHGNIITITKGKVIVDGKDLTPDSKQITIIINGNIQELSVDYCESFEMKGNCNSLKTMSGDVKIKGDINGPVKTMSGNVKANQISGGVNTMSGNIKQND